MAQKVMICVDGSEFANEALSWYSQNFYKEGHKCYVVYVPESFVNASMMSPARHLECRREAEEHTTQLKKQYQELAAKCNLPGAEVIAAEPKEDEKTGATLIRVAKELDPLFIITGTRGMGKFRRTILGSVSDYLVHHSSCPVLVARHKDHHSGQQQMDQ